jgi:uncharacterized protein YyaL (SSP411 family)
MTVFRVLSNDVAWLPWNGRAFARARTERKPVLLSISVPWCRWCREMDRTSYADPSIATMINERFIPIRVDADERPDIGERYNLGGWPTTAFLTPDGTILGGGTFVPVERMAGALAQVVDAFEAHATQGDRASAGVAAPRVSDSTPIGIEGLSAHVFTTFDEEHGGFGAGAKFPLTAPSHLALDLFAATHDPRYETIAVATLDGMGWRGLYDEVDGGFFRYATTRDWQLPQTEKMLESNAALLRLYLDAGDALGIARFTERGADTLRYIQTWLADPVDGAWSGSQQADDRYYAGRSVEERRASPAPAVAGTIYADWNGAMVSAALQAARTFADDGLRDFALTSLERVLLACYKPGAGVAHYFTGDAPGSRAGIAAAGSGERRHTPGPVRGLLADQIAMASAALDAFDTTGNVVYEMMAEELGQYAIRVMWDERDGGFFDRAVDDGEAGQDDQVGLMRERLQPFALNCDASRMLRRLAAASGDQEFTRVADLALAAMAPRAIEQGPLAAHYVLAVRAASVR